MQRRISRQVAVGAFRIGGTAPIVVQSMTNTDTEDAQATARQVEALARAGSELVRITVNTPQAAAQVPRIRDLLDSARGAVPLIGDFHYNGHKLLTQYPDCARALAKYRINPGNVGRGTKRDEQFATLIECALRHDKPVRIGVKARSPMVWRISCATCTSRVRSPPGSGVSETRIVSPMPSCRRTASAAVDATMPFDPMPASVRPRSSA